MPRKINAALARQHHHLRGLAGHYATQTTHGLRHQAENCATCKAAGKDSK